MSGTTAGFFAGFTVDELERFILWEIGQVSGTTISYDRFPKWLIRAKLTERQNQFVFHSKCIRKFALIVAKEGYSRYKLPDNCMDGGVIAVRYYTDSDEYTDLEMTDIYTMDQKYPGWLVASDSTPQAAFMGDSYGNVPMLEVYPAPESDGTAYSVSTDTGIATGGDLPGAVSNISGTATGGSTTTLIDTNTTFTDLGLVAGIYARNVTDGSYGYLLTIAENTLTFAAALTGGTDNTFTAGDSYVILAGEYGVIIDVDNTDQYIFGSEAGILTSITVPDDNFRVDFIPYPTPFSFDAASADADQGNDDQYPEIPKLYHHGLAMGVVADLLRTFNEGSKEFKRAETYEQMYAVAVAKASGKTERPFARRGSRIKPRKR